MEDFTLTPPEGKEVRFKEFKDVIFRFYIWRWKQECPWDASEGAQLSRLLKASPNLDVKTFAQWLLNYGTSLDITPGERPRNFLPRIHDYSQAILDRFRRAQDAEIPDRKMLPTRREASNGKQSSAERLRQELDIARGFSRYGD